MVRISNIGTEDIFVCSLDTDYYLEPNEHIDCCRVIVQKGWIKIGKTQFEPQCAIASSELHNLKFSIK